MADKVLGAIGLGVQTPQGPTAAEKAVQAAQRASAEREAIAARQEAALSASGGLRGALAFDDRKRKGTLGG